MWCETSCGVCDSKPIQSQRVAFTHTHRHTQQQAVQTVEPPLCLQTNTDASRNGRKLYLSQNNKISEFMHLSFFQLNNSTMMMKIHLWIFHFTFFNWENALCPTRAYRLLYSTVVLNPLFFAIFAILVYWHIVRVFSIAEICCQRLLVVVIIVVNAIGAGRQLHEDVLVVDIVYW